MLLLPRGELCTLDCASAVGATSHVPVCTPHAAMLPSEELCTLGCASAVLDEEGFGLIA